MGDFKNLLASTRKWLPLFSKAWLLGLIMFARVTYEDQVGEPEADLLCISDCTTCPVICSPPPPPPSPVQKSQPPPSPPVNHSPPPTYYTFSPPPPPPPQASPPKKTPPPPSPTWYYTSGSPPPPYKNDVPFSPWGKVPPTPGSHDYPYPYYYLYASDASPVSVHGYCFFFVVLSFLFFSGERLTSMA
ncbi:hypothetical protein TorRG33x02_082360 [Trema orientale]|uniref:Uncharacterized protein n=1 Tax=Trema orientale TaxID=63057 RepID=A0A2P5FDX8_TREOI|nr:hypothetical protein TorRG33x02_082360 [Trema orientale]